MTYESLEQGIKLKETIKSLNDALRCFTYNTPSEAISTNPKIIIEYDDEEGGRSQAALPIVLSENFIEYIKQEIVKSISVNFEKLKSL